MSPKAKKHRRDIIKREFVSPENKPVIAPSQATASVKAQAKTNFTEEATKSFFRDIRWIGLTTLIIVVLFVIAYFAIPR